MKKVFIIGTVFLLVPSFILCQSQFVKAYGGADADRLNSIIQTADGGYAMVGYSNSFSVAGYDWLLVKVDGTGNVQWAKNLDILDNFDEATSIIQTSDGGYAISGGKEDWLIVKVDGSGNFQWTKCISGELLSSWPRSLIQTSDGGYAIVDGCYGTFRDFRLIKFDSSWNLQWAKVVAGPTNEWPGFACLIQTSDGGYAIAGKTSSYGAGNGDCILVKFDASGNYQWCKTLGGSLSEKAQSLVQASDGGYVFTGYTYSYGAGSGDILLAKFQANGNYDWSVTFGETGIDEGYSIIQTADGGYVIGGYSDGFGAGGYDWLIIKVDDSGTFQWAKALGGTGAETDLSLIQTSDGGFAVAGYSNSFGEGNIDFLLAKYDSDGNTCIGEDVIPIVTSPSPAISSPSPTVTSPSPAFTSPSPTITSPSPAETTICESSGITEKVVNDIPLSSKFSIFPNPSLGNVTISFFLEDKTLVSLEIYDILGRLVYTPINRKRLNRGKYRIIWDRKDNYGEEVPCGIYFCRLETKQEIHNQRIILLTK